MNSHEYLIEQISNSRDNNIKLDFNHPIKEISYLLKLQNIQKYNKDNKDDKDIDNLCVLFNKLYLPIKPKTYVEHMNNLSQNDKDKLKIYNSIENKWYLYFLEIKI